MAMKLLVISDFAQTGFGRVGNELTRRFYDAGVDIRVIAINWGDRLGEAMRLLQQENSTDDVVHVLREMDADPLSPFKISAQAAGDGMGYNLTAPAIRGMIRAWQGWKPDCVLVVADPRAMVERIVRSEGAFNDVPTFNYVPIEGDHLPPFWRSIWETITPVAMSEFGQTQLQELLGKPVPMVPHGVSDGFFQITPRTPGNFKGQSIASKDAAKAAVGVPGRTVLLRTDRFVLRKDYPALFHAVGPILTRHPDVVLVIHCSPQDEGGQMAELISHLPGAFIHEGRWGHPQVKLTKAHDTFRGLTDGELNVLYNAADIYLSPTMAEGFGLTLAEAAACGVPVVTTDFAAGPEAVGPGAVLIPPRAHFVNVYAHNWALVDEDKFGAAVEHLIDKPAKRREIGAAGARYVAGRFTWDRAASEFLDLFGYQREAVAA